MATNVSERMLALADVIDALAAQSKTIAADPSLDPRHNITDCVYIAGKHAALADAITAVTGLLDALWTPNTGDAAVDDHITKSESEEE